tara:strand:- start:5757 stop:6161 length:405 start_codon:yes stop_codon:yes gene_type:complete
MRKNAKNELARDIIALGSIAFYIIVIVRALIGRFSPFVYQLIIAILLLMVLSRFINGANQYIARGFILLAFISLYYKSITFTFFSSILWVCMIFSLIHLKVKCIEIKKGILLGAVSAAIAYYLAPLIMAAQITI